ncbi:unnamed protein product [Diamesa serratosioi]
MNALLALRVGCAKNEDSIIKKNKQNVKDLIKIEECFGEGPDEIIQKINEAICVERQQDHIKKLAFFIKQENLPELKEKIVNLLIKIYFGVQIKHPVKDTIACSFNQLKDYELLIVKCLKENLDDLVRSVDKSSMEDCYHIISCLNESSQNFKPCIRAVGEKVHVIIVFIKELVDIYDVQLKELHLSPAQKNEISIRFHHCIQSVIFCIKNYLIGASEIESTVKINLDSIVTTCYELLVNPELPMDTKTNCGILIVMQSKLSNEKRYIDRIYDEDESCANRLCLITGAISAMDNSSDNFVFFAKISNILKDIFDKNSVDPAIILSVSRCFVQITKKMTLVKDFDESLHTIDSIATTALSFSFLNLEHYMDSIRHLARDTFKNIAEASTKFNAVKVKDLIFELILLVTSMSLKSIIIMTICAGIKVDTILEKIPNLISLLLMSIEDNLVSNQNIINCYESLLTQSFVGCDFEKWFSFWMMPVIDQYLKSAPGEKKAMYENLLKKCIKIDKKVLDSILNCKDLEIGFILLCLGTGKKNGHYDKLKSTDELWKGILSYEKIKEAMLKEDPAIRIPALSLIVDSRKTTELFSVQEFECICFFLEYNINVQEPSVRQSIKGLLKNTFIRVQSGLQVLIRKHDPSAENYFLFLVKLQEFCLGNLFDGANYTRRTLSLRTLCYALDAIKDHFPDRAAGIWNCEKTHTLINCLNDSYESNKEMAIEVMKFIPSEVLREHNNITIELIRKSVLSVRPVESLASSYYMEFLTKFAFPMEEFAIESASKIQPEVYLMVRWCEDLLIDGLEIAEKSLILASNNNPLYGLLLSVRHLLGKMELKELSGCLLWRALFKRLILLCKDLTTVVGPIVNNSSPEGVMPVNNENDVVEIEVTTPQMILLCAWRTVKEISLLLGDICLRAQIIKENEAGLITTEQVLYIGDHFLELLSKTKHRGAFEQCYHGFSLLSLRLCVAEEPELHSLPGQMIHQMITSISGVDNVDNELLQMKNLCATRRSAGLPFLLQALITAEMKVSASKSAFSYVMRNLFKFCEQGDILESRTHSLNILRALFRCCDLNESINEYVSDGVKCAIKGLNSDFWIERNSSTLFFSALMIRIFGVQRSRDSDDLNIRNKMTGRIFFLRYPELYDFFIGQLIEAAEFVNQKKVNGKLHPMMLLLNRLYSSPLEGVESNLTLTKFISLVSKCSGCLEMHTRILCAKFVANILPKDFIFSRIENVLEIMRNTENSTANSNHGALLQVLYLVRSVTNENEANILKLMSLLKDIVAITKRFAEQLICFGTLMDIILEVLQKCWLVLNQNSMEVLEVIETCLSYEISNSMGTEIVKKRFVLLKLVKVHLGGSSEFLMSIDFKTDLNDLQSIMNLILLFLDFKYMKNMLEEYQIKQKELFIIKNMFVGHPEKLNELINQLKTSKQLKNNLYEIVAEDNYYHSTIKAYEILSFINYQKGDCDCEHVATLIENVMEKPENYKNAILKYVNVCLANETEFINKLDLGSLLMQISTGPSFLVKLTATEIVQTLSTNFYSITSMELLLYFSRAILLLLMDDESEIREKNSQTVLNLFNRNNLTLWSTQSYIPIYAQKLYLQTLTEKLSINFSKSEIIALIILIFLDENEVENNDDAIIAEYRVFDKNEVNIFSELFVMKKHCLMAIKKTFLGDLNISSIAEMFPQIIQVTNAKFSTCPDEDFGVLMENYLNTLFVHDLNSLDDTDPIQW